MTDAELLLRFEDLTLPGEEWTHRAHVKVAYLYLSRHPFPAALDRLRNGIKVYNAAGNVPESPTSGYNETTTVAFAHLIAATMYAYGDAFPTATADDFCDTHPQLLTRHALRLFYSPARRTDPRAKSEFLEPDLAPPAAADREQVSAKCRRPFSDKTARLVRLAGSVGRRSGRKSNGPPLLRMILPPRSLHSYHRRSEREQGQRGGA